MNGAVEPLTESVAQPRGKAARERPRRPAPWMLIALSAFAVCVAAFAPTLGGGFLGDDFGYVGRFARFSLSEWPRLFVREWSEGMWENKTRELRPVTALSFIVDAHVWGVNAPGFRVTNLMLHAGCSTLVGLLAWRAAERARACGIAAAIWFALHPVHAEPVL